MEADVAAVIKRKLRAWGDEKINTAKLVELRKEITDKTGKYKFAPFSNIKKWVRQARKALAAEGRPARREKARRAAPPAEAPLPPALSDRVFLQNISFEVAGMRRTLERISQQLDVLERQLALKRGAA